MHTAMNIGVFARREIAHRVENLLGLLCRRRIVEIDKRLAVNLARQNFEIRACDQRIERRRNFRLRGHDAFSIAAGNAASTARQTSPRIVSSAISETVSSRNARMSRLRASLSGMPRARR